MQRIYPWLIYNKYPINVKWPSGHVEVWVSDIILLMDDGEISYSSLCLCCCIKNCNRRSHHHLRRTLGQWNMLFFFTFLTWKKHDLNCRVWDREIVFSVWICERRQCIMVIQSWAAKLYGSMLFIMLHLTKYHCLALRFNSPPKFFGTAIQFFPVHILPHSPSPESSLLHPIRLI